MRCENGHRWTYQTEDGKLLLLGNEATNESVERIMRLIDEKTVTAEDFDRFIAETIPTSINKRVQRQMRPGKIGPQVTKPGRKVDDKTDREPPDHNDPTTTARGRGALKRQIKHNKAHSDQFREAVEFLQTNKGKPLSECQAKLANISNPVALRRLTTVLAKRPSQLDQEWRDWLIGLDETMSKYYGKT